MGIRTTCANCSAPELEVARLEFWNPRTYPAGPVTDLFLIRPPQTTQVEQMLLVGRDHSPQSHAVATTTTL